MIDTGRPPVHAAAPRCRTEPAVKIDLKELREGPNPVAFDVNADEAHTWFREVDGLYRGQGEPLHADLSLQRLDDIILVRGSLAGPYGYTCARCLAERSEDLDLDVTWTLMPHDKMLDEQTSPDEEFELTTDDLDVSFFDSDEIDLGALMRELVLLELDPIPHCEVDACEADGYLTAHSQAEPDEGERLDPRWAPLAALKQKLASSAEDADDASE